MLRRTIVAFLATGAALVSAQAPEPAPGDGPAPIQQPRHEPPEPTAPQGSNGRAGPVPRPGKDSIPPKEAGTPKGALKLLAAAMRDGDAERIRALMHAANPAEARMVSAMADMAAALATLQRTSVKAYGADGARDVVGDLEAPSSEGLRRIQSAKVEVVGDTATVLMAEKDAPVLLKQVGGFWKVPMSELSKGAEPDALDQRLNELAVQMKLVLEISDEIAAGKYPTPQKAADAWHARMMQALMPRPVKKTATRASTPPAERGSPVTPEPADPTKP